VAEPTVAAARQSRWNWARWGWRGWHARWHAFFHPMEPPLRRGYAVWSLVGLAIAVPEISAAIWKQPWPTISGTVGHLETRWNIVAVVVVAVIVLIAARAVRLFTAPPVSDALGALLPAPKIDAMQVAQVSDRPVFFRFYFVGALVCVILGSYIASTMSDNRWVLGYVIYGLIGFFGILIPTAMTYSKAKNPPFTGLFPTILDLEVRWHPAALIVLTGLVVLLIHLGFYPWPDVFHQNPSPGSP
jgi:hypothetical protein